MSALGTNASPRAVWQVSAGPASRTYADVLLKRGVALVGPGDAGPWTPERDDNDFDGGFVRRFDNSPPTYWQTAPLPELPTEEPPLVDVPDVLQGIIAQAADLVPLFQDGQSFGEPPSEDELIVHFVVPFLRALGWPPERIAVKWRYIDVTVFHTLPRTPENCHLVIEAKRLGAGVEGALEQAKGYVGSLGIPRDVIVTDGIRYRMYAGGHEFQPVAYANLTRLKKPAADLFARMQRP